MEVCKCCNGSGVQQVNAFTESIGQYVHRWEGCYIFCPACGGDGLRECKVKDKEAAKIPVQVLTPN